MLLEAYYLKYGSESQFKLSLSSIWGVACMILVMMFNLIFSSKCSKFKIIIRTNWWMRKNLRCRQLIKKNMFSYARQTEINMPEDDK